MPAVSAPITVTPASLPAAEAEAVRNTYLKHEASLKSVGVLYLIGSFLLVAVGTASLFGLIPADRKNPDASYQWLVGRIFIVVGCLPFQVGRWLRALNPKARTPATALSILGLFGFPVGTLINVYILYLLRSKKGAMVFSDHYHEIVAATPHIKYKTSLVVWIFVGLLVFLLALALIIPLFASRHH